jgi:hypothetical protein
MAISDYNASASLNTSIGGIDIGEGAPRANVNDAIRQLMADIKSSIGTVAFTPETYGAVGDGTTDDFTAFALMVAAVNAAGGGPVSLSHGKTYFLNRYIGDGLAPTLVNTNNGTLAFVNCAGLAIEGNGAIIKPRGNFNRTATTTHALSGLTLISCTNVSVRNLTVYGNVEATTRTALLAENPNSSGVMIRGGRNILLSNIYSHHTQADGFVITRDPATVTPVIPPRNVTLIDCRAEYNARQGLSVIQCRTASFIGCSFNFTGKSTGAYGVHAPTAGVDVEPNFTTATASPDTMEENTGDLAFYNCEMRGNYGPSFVMADDTVESVALRSCRMESSAETGVTAGFTFGCAKGVVENCSIKIADRRLWLGYNAPNSSIVFRANGVSSNGSSAITLYSTISTLFADNRIVGTHTAPMAGYLLLASNPNAVYAGNYFYLPGAAYIDGGVGDFDTAMFDGFGTFRNNKWETNLLAAAGSSGTAHYANAYDATATVTNDKFTGAAPGLADTWRPSSVNVEHDTTKAYSTTELIRSTTWNPPSLATATQQSTTITATGAALGDLVDTVAFSLNLSGTRLWGEVTAANVVTVYHRNDTGGTVDVASGTLRVVVRKQ